MYVRFTQDEEFQCLAKSCYYEYLLHDIQMRTTNEVKENILLRSAEGRARSGHRPFRVFEDKAIFQNQKSGRRMQKNSHIVKYTNATAYDIAKACSMNPEEQAAFSQKNIEDVMLFFEDAMQGNISGYKNKHGKPLYGIIPFNDIEVTREDIPSLLMGAYLTGCMDTEHHRKLVDELFQISIGYGMTTRINRKLVLAHGKNLEALAKFEHTEEDLKRLKGQGIIMEDGPVSEDHVNGYIRMREGCGSLDDIMKIISGIKYGEHAYYGAVLQDATDTWDKFTTNIIQCGYDELLTHLIKEKEGQIKKHFSSFSLPSDEDVAKSVFLTAKQHYPLGKKSGAKTSFSHCSFRYEHQIDRGTSRTIFEMHRAYCKGQKTQTVSLSHPSLKLDNKMLYKAFEDLCKKYPEKL